MISRIFKNNDKLAFIAIPLFGVLLWIFSFFILGYSKTDFSSGILLPFLFQHIDNHTYFKIANLIFLIGGAFLLNYIAIEHEITEKQNFIPALIYLLLASTMNSQNILHPILIANLFILIALMKFFGTYRSDNSFSSVFDASFLLSCASLIYWPVLMIIPVCFIALFILKSVDFREGILIFMGIVLPYLITATLFWVFNIEYVVWKNSFAKTFSGFHLPFFPPGSFLINTAGIILMALSFIFMFTKGFGGKVKTKKTKYVLIWLIFPGISAAFFSIESPVFIGMATIIPFSFLVGDYIGQMKKSAIADFLILLLITAVILSDLQAKAIL